MHKTKSRDIVFKGIHIQKIAENTQFNLKKIKKTHTELELCIDEESPYEILNL